MRLAGLPGILIFQGLFQGLFQGAHQGLFQYLLRVLQYLLWVLQYPLRPLLYLFLKTGRRRGLVLLFIFRLFGERRLISSVWLMYFMNWGFLRIRMGFAAQRRRLSGRLEGR